MNLLHGFVNLDNNLIMSFKADSVSHLCGDIRNAFSRPACKSILARRPLVIRFALCLMYGRKHTLKCGVEIRAQKML